MFLDGSRLFKLQLGTGHTKTKIIKCPPQAVMPYLIAIYTLAVLLLIILLFSYANSEMRFVQIQSANM